MFRGSLLARLIHTPDPLGDILEYLVSRLEPLIDLDDIASSYERIEEELRDFEMWFHNIWGRAFYINLLGDEGEWAIPKALRAAGERNCNLLVCDGLSLRELLIIRKALPGRVTYTPARTPAPTTTETVAKKIFNSPNLEEALTGSKLLQGREWSGMSIPDIRNPPRTGGQRGLIFLTHYPDAPLHRARSYGTTQIQDVSQVIMLVTKLVEQLSRNIPLMVTGDHGYIFLGTNPNRYMWLPYRRQERFGGEYGENGIELEGVKIAIGRYHTHITPGSGSFIAHGGISLTESLVPVIMVEAEAPS